MKKTCSIALAVATALCCAGLTTYPCHAETPQSRGNTSIASTVATATTPTTAPVVQTKYGKVEGLVKDGITRFYGVPFAKPPLGELRFCAPQEPDPWEGTLSCKKCRSVAMQKPLIKPDGVASALTAIDGTVMSPSEDCLYLNIYAPPEAKDAPVFVWIHGGALIFGNASSPMYDGATFARDGIIVVSIDYRLGAWGYTSHPDIAEGASLGALDQIQALRWVHDNIAAFGGDPESITVGGESAGAFSTSSLIFSPLTRGLFQQAILQSGNILGCASAGDNIGSKLESVQTRTREIMRRAGCKTAEEFIACSPEKLLEVSNFDTEILRSIHVKDNVSITCDGKVLPTDFRQALRAGKYNRVRLLCGFNHDEGSLFVNTPSVEQYNSYIDAAFRDKAAEIKEHFPADETNVRQRSLDMVRNTYFGGGNIVMADQMVRDGGDVYVYEFQFTPKDPASSSLGSRHGLELPFVFDTLPANLQADPQSVQVKDTVHKYWANFIKHGNPNSADVPTWARYTGDGKNCMVIDETSSVQKWPFYDDINFLFERMEEH